MDKGRVLVLDGLDKLRDELDTLAIQLEGWQFRMVAAPVPFEIGDIMVEGYNKDIKKHAGLVIREKDIESGQWEAMLGKMKTAIQSHDE